MNELTWLYLNDGNVRAEVNKVVLMIDSDAVNPLLMAEHPDNIEGACDGDSCPIGTV